MSLQRREEVLRVAMTDLYVGTPKDLIALTGCDPSVATREDIQQACRDYRANGYTQEKVTLRAYGPAVEMFVRRDRWPEDSQ
jgi:hypothetical protein